MVAVVTTTSLNVDESDGAVLVCVSLSQLPFQDIVSVSVITSSGTAQGDSHNIPYIASVQYRLSYSCVL